MKFTHLHVHSHYSLLDGLPKIDELLDYVKELGMDSVALTDHGVLYGAVEFYKKAKERGIKPIIGCLPPGHLIYTSKGMKPIEKIQVGDLVLTHRGRFRRVRRTMVRPHKGILYGIEARNANTVWLTGEHPVLVSSYKMDEPQWIRADSLKYGRRNRHGDIKSWESYALFPKLKEPIDNQLNILEYLDQKIYSTDGKVILKTGKYSKYDSLMITKIPVSFKINHDFAKLLGLFLAEGSYQYDPRGRATTLVFSFNGHENHLTDFTARALQFFAKTSSKVLYRPERDLKEIYTHNTVFSRFFKNFCGQGAGEKYIPLTTLKWSYSYLESFLDALAAGDAHINPNTGQINLKIKSRNLAWGVRLIAATLGYPTKVGIQKERGRIYYRISWTPTVKYRRVLENNDYLFLPIKKIKKRKYDGRVYNFEVEEDNSYVSDIALHNCEVYTAFERMDQKRPNIDDKRYHLVLLVKNEKGYKNLVQLITKAHLEGFYYKPRVDDELLAKHSEGLIALTGCVVGKIPRLIQSKRIEEAEKLSLKYQEIFGKDNFYLEIQSHPNIPEQKTTNAGLIAISKKYGIPLVATNDIHYLKPGDKEAQDILMLINTNSDKNDPERLTMKTDDFSLKTPQEMIGTFKDIPEAIENTQKIVELCNFGFELGKTKLPYFEVPNNKTPDEYLEELCQQGLKNRFGENPEKEARERLNYELSIIKQTGFASYFLIVQDFVNWAKKNRIVVGPGRGSIGGSLVAYALNITNINPLKNNLIFERFLNPSRVSFPDIDLDFTDRRRNEVIDYVAQKYGRDKVAQIITFGTMAARAVIRDVGRALNYPYGYCDQIAKMIPFGFDLEQTLKRVVEFQNLYQIDEQAKNLIDLAKKLEGVARHASTHACGVVISNKPLTDLIPLQHPTQDDENIVTQYEMHSVEDLGLLKMDFLGLKNLTIIEDTLSRIYVIHNKKIDIENIPLNDKETYKLLQKGNTVGIFQLEGEGITRYLKQLKPSEFEDIVAMAALYRPGPIQFIPDYIARKHKKQKIEYLHPKLKPILEKTQGICIYQEQLMQIAQQLAGFSLAEADILRKAIGKKIKSLLLEQEEKFIQGMIKNEIKKEIAQRIWQWILPFAEYGFNRSHSCAYATIAYQTAYLKANFPVEFMASLLTSEKVDIERIAILIEECKRMGIEVLAPNINQSLKNFTVVPGENKIRFGLLAIKNVGKNIIDVIVNEIKNNGPFKSIEDFIQRVNSKDLNKKSLESLIKTGAFDKFAERNQLLHNLERLLEWAKETQKNKANGQKGLFDKAKGENFNNSIYLKQTVPATTFEKLSWEKELLGLYVSSHPLEDYKNVLKKNALSLAEIKNYNGRIRVGGIISGIKKIITRTNKTMLFVKLEDLTDKTEVVVFPAVIERNPTAFQENKIVFVSGRLDHRDNVPKIIADQVEEIVNKTS